MELKRYAGKPDKQRIMDAVAGERLDGVPDFEILIEDRILENTLGRHVGGATLGNMNQAPLDAHAPDKAQKAYEGGAAEDMGRPILAEDHVGICEIIAHDAIGIIGAIGCIPQGK